MRQPLTGESAERKSRFTWKSFTRNLPRQAYFRYTLVIIKVLLGLALLVLSVRGIQWNELIRGLRSINLTWLTLAIFAVLLGLSLKFWRWLILIRNYQVESGINKLFSAYFVGQAMNIILPFRSGELVRVGYFAGEMNVIPEVITTIIIEKYLDLLALAISMIVVSYKFSLSNILNLRPWLLPLSVFLTLLFLVIIFFAPAAWRRIRTANMANFFGRWLDRWVRASNWLRHPKHVLPGILLTISIWIVMLETNLLLFKSFGLSLGGTAAALVLVLVYIGLLPALMPGNIGPFYYFASLALVPFGIVHEQAFIFAVMLHAIVSLPPIIAGLVGLLLRPRVRVNT